MKQLLIALLFSLRLTAEVTTYFTGAPTTKYGLVNFSCQVMWNDTATLQDVVTAAVPTSKGEGFGPVSQSGSVVETVSCVIEGQSGQVHSITLPQSDSGLQGWNWVGGHLYIRVKPPQSWELQKRDYRLVNSYNLPVEMSRWSPSAGGWTAPTVVQPSGEYDWTLEGPGPVIVAIARPRPLVDGNPSPDPDMVSYIRLDAGDFTDDGLPQREVVVTPDGQVSDEDNPTTIASDVGEKVERLRLDGNSNHSDLLQALSAIGGALDDIKANTAGGGGGGGGGGTTDLAPVVASIEGLKAEVVKQNTPATANPTWNGAGLPGVSVGDIPTVVGVAPASSPITQDELVPGIKKDIREWPVIKSLAPLVRTVILAMLGFTAAWVFYYRANQRVKEVMATPANAPGAQGALPGVAIAIVGAKAAIWVPALATFMATILAAAACVPLSMLVPTFSTAFAGGTGPEAVSLVGGLGLITFFFPIEECLCFISLLGAQSLLFDQVAFGLMAFTRTLFSA